MAIDTETMQLIERVVARAVANATSLKGAADEIAKGVTQYVGARYVPLFAEPLEWDGTKAYEPLTIVLHQGNSYTSRQYVPVGIEIDDGSFWAQTGNYNAQVERYRQEVKALGGQIADNAGAIAAEAARATAAEGKLTDDLGAEVTRATAAEGELTDGLGAEVARATAAEGKLTDGLGAEVTRATAAEGKLTDGLASLALKGKNFVTPFAYGAVGDGVTDDTESIGRWLNSGMTAVLPKGTFYVTHEISVTGPVTVIGAGGKIKIKSHAEDDVYTFTFNDDTTIYGVEFESVHDNTVKGINDSLNDVPCSNVKPIACRNATALNIVNCAFKNVYIAVFSNGVNKTTDVNIDSCLFDNVYSVVFSNNSNVAVNNCDIYVNENANVYYHVAYPSQEGDIDYLKLTGNTVKYNPVDRKISTFISANSTSELHQSIKDVIIMNNYVENMRILYLYQDNVNVSNFVFDSNTFVYDTNVLSGYVSIVSFIGGNIDMDNSNFINKTPALYLTSNKAQKINFNSCNFINFYVAGESGSIPEPGNVINFNSCTFKTDSFNAITANTTFSNCAISHTGTSSAKTLFTVKTDVVKLIMLNTAIVGSGEKSYVFSADTTESNTHCVSCVFENVQYTFLGAQKLTGCFRNETAI